jgi:hypothetical protein
LGVELAALWWSYAPHRFGGRVDVNHGLFEKARPGVPAAASIVERLFFVAVGAPVID